MCETSLFPALMLAGRSEIDEDVWVDITEDKIWQDFFLPLEYLHS